MDNILVVEDEIAIAELIELNLKKQAIIVSMC